MPAESGLLGLYWSARQEPLETCVGRAYRTFRALQSAGYDRYFFLGRSRRDALKRQFEVSEENVRVLLGKGVNREDLPPRPPIPELGWSIAFWSGDADDESYAISIHCGAYSPAVGNSVVIKLPPAGPLSLSVSPDGALKAYRSLVEIWEPDQAVLCEGSIDWEGGRLVPLRVPLAQHPQPARRSQS